MSEGAVRVAVRVRPLNAREKKKNSKKIIEMHNKQTWIHNPEKQGDVKKFTYDHSYWSFDKGDKNYASQDMVYEDLGADVIKAAFDGFNACVFAYGQTGAGKSYTMMGYGEEIGLIPRICEEIFEKVAANTDPDTKYSATVSYLEIYNEHVKDLLVKGAQQKKNLRVREHPKTGPFVDGLSEHAVSSYDEINDLMDLGNTNRTVAATNMNDTSSRSHAIFTLQFHQAAIVAGIPAEKASKINLVDLAGSERTSATGATGQRLKEGGNINKSLTTLGLCISALAERSSHKKKKKGNFIPFRDSVLTWLLKESLGGNSKTIMVAAISPADINYGETLSTLHYANRAKNIVNKPIVNEDENVRLIRELRAEIERLTKLLGGDEEIKRLEAETAAAQDKVARAETSEEKEEAEAQLEKMNQQLSQAKSADKSVLQAQIAQSQEMMSALTNKWKSKFDSMSQIMEDRALNLEESGRALRVGSEKPHFVSLNLDDPLATGVTLYYLNEGATTIGRVEGRASYDFQAENDIDEPEIVEDSNSEDEEVSATTPTNEPAPPELKVEEPVADEGDETTGNEISKDAFDDIEEPPTLDDDVISQVADAPELDISLSAPDIEPLHCIVQYDGAEMVTIRPGSESALIYINGNEVQTEIELMQGYTVQLGNSTVFRFNHPLQAKKMRDLRKAMPSSAIGPGQLLSDKMKQDRERIQATTRRLQELEEMAQKKEEMEIQLAQQDAERRKLEEERNIAEQARQQEWEEQQKETAERIAKMEEERLAKEAELKKMREEHERRQIELQEQLEAEKKRLAEAARLAEEEQLRKEQEAQQRLDEERAKVEEEERRRQEEFDKLAQQSAEAARLAEEEARKTQEQLQADLQRQQQERERQRQEAQAELERKQKLLENAEERMKQVKERADRHEKTFSEIWEISIPKYMQRGDHFVYQIDMSLHGQKWSIWRRYTQFEKLHKQLKAKIPMIANYVKLPPKVKISLGSMFHKNRPEFLEERRTRLETYLNDVVSKSYRLPSSPFYNTDRSTLERTMPFFGLGSHP